MNSEMQKSHDAVELIEAMRPVSGEMRAVYECQGCGQLIGRRFIPFGLGRGLSVNLCMCQATGPNTPMTRLMECRP